MWPFKQRKTITLPIEVTVELPKTADGHRLEEMVVCYDCGQLVLKNAAKEVEYRCIYPWSTSVHIRYYCQTHAPAWDVASGSYRVGGACTHRYRRIPTVPERLEEIVEAPVRVVRKRKSKKVAS